MFVSVKPVVVATFCGHVVDKASPSAQPRASPIDCIRVIHVVGKRERLGIEELAVAFDAANRSCPRGGLHARIMQSEFEPKFSEGL